MSTEAQISANRENAQKSTGPTSPEGKEAVSQNAVKHGLWARQDVIKGEDEAEFQLFRDEILAELAPATPVETMLCQRFVSLSWRLKRAERMQNQAIDVMMARDEPSPLSKQLTAALPKHLRAVREDPRGAGPELLLGRAAIKDFTNYKVLGQLSMYERRIESSMFKTMAELRNLRLARELRQAEAESAAETAAPQTDEANFAKQSQFNIRSQKTEDRRQKLRDTRFGAGRRDIPAPAVQNKPNLREAKVGARLSVAKAYKNNSPSAARPKQSQTEPIYAGDLNQDRLRWRKNSMK